MPVNGFILTISHGNNILPCHKLYSLCPHPLNPSSPHRVHSVQPIPPKLLFSPPVGRNSNLQSPTRDKTSRRHFPASRILNIHYTLTKSARHTCTARLHPRRGKSNTLSLAIRRSRPPTSSRKYRRCWRNNGKFSSTCPQNP